LNIFGSIGVGSRGAVGVTLEVEISTPRWAVLGGFEVLHGVADTLQGLGAMDVSEFGWLEGSSAEGKTTFIETSFRKLEATWRAGSY
jgi:hypothetical protein